MKLLDTSAWVEYFKGSTKGEKVKVILKQEPVGTSAITFAEIAKWFTDNNGDVEFAVEHIKRNSIIIPLEEPILVQSGKSYRELRKRCRSIGLIDVIIYVTALLHGLELLTTDNDFRSLPSVILL